MIIHIRDIHIQIHIYWEISMCHFYFPCGLGAISYLISLQEPHLMTIPTRQYDTMPLQWRHNEHDGVSNHQPRDCLLKHLFKAQLKTKPSKFRVTGLCEGNSPVTGEFPAQRASNAENVSIWWRHHGMLCFVPHFLCWWVQWLVVNRVS